MTNKEIYQKAFSKMSNPFTSNEMAKMCIKLGLIRKFITNGNMLIFLHEKAHRDEGSKRTWYKRELDIQVSTIITERKEVNISEEQRCIDYLKSLNKGYKITITKTIEL